MCGRATSVKGQKSKCDFEDWDIMLNVIVKLGASIE